MRWQGVLVALLLLALPLAARAQCPPPLVPPDAAPPCLEEWPSWSGHLAVLGGNALLGGLSAGVASRIRGGDFSDAFLRGLAGGAVVYGGKRVAVEPFGGAGLLGRQLSAVGASMVRNAGDGLPALERLSLPAGPLWVHLQAERPHIRASVDLMATGWLISGLANPDLRFDAGLSISSGSHVFVADNRIIDTESEFHAHAITEPGMIAMGRVPAFGRRVASEVFRHEIVHVLQMDQLFLSVTRPGEQAVLGRVPGLRRAAPWVELNLSGLLLGALGGPFDSWASRPWETEALFLTGR
jgi:hypothetical protein